MILEIDEKKYFIKWWQKILLFFLPTYVSFDNGNAYFYKKWRGVMYWTGFEKLDQKAKAD